MNVDLHTHSVGSPDGGLDLNDYRQALVSGRLDYVAITDHGSIETALEFGRLLDELAGRVIVGEEIKTTEGEIIGLYLREAIPDGLTPQRTVDAVKAQNGLVYVPHPFETVRSGVSEAALGKIIDEVDIIETHNGRALFGRKGRLAEKWAMKYDKAQASSSDAHGRRGWTRSYSIIAEAPTRDNLVQQLRKGGRVAGRPGISVVYPKFNRLRKKLTRGSR